MQPDSRRRPTPPPGFLPSARRCAWRTTAVLLFSSLAAACGGPPTRPPAPPRIEAGTTRSDSRATAGGALVDVTVRPGSSQATLLLLQPTPAASRPGVRARLAARAAALSEAVRALGAELGVETLAGAPGLAFTVPDARLGELLTLLAERLSAPLPADAPTSPSPLLPGDTLDALGAAEATTPPVVLLVHGEGSVGPVTGLDALAEVERAWLGGAAAPSASPAHRGPRVEILRRGSGPARVAQAWTMPAAASGAAELLAMVLAGSPESRLARALGPAGLEGATVQAELRPDAGGGERLVLTLQTGADEVDTAWQLVTRVVTELAASPVTSAELARARATLADRLAFERSTSGDLARRRAAMLLRRSAPLPPEAEFDRALDALDLEPIQALGAALAGGTPTGIVATPTADAEVDDALWAESLAEASRQRPVSGTGATEARPGVYTLAPGLTLLAHPRPSDTVVAFELRIAGGALAEPPELPGAGALAAAVLGRPLESPPFPMQGRLGRDHLALSIVAPAERWTEALDVLSRRISRWPQRADVFEDARARVQQGRAARQSDPARWAWGLAEQGLGDPALSRDLLGTASGLADRTGVEVRNFIESRVDGAPMTLVTVGPIATERLIPAIRAALGPLARAADLPTPPAVPRGLRLERSVDADTTCAAVGYPLPDLRDRQFATAEVLAALVAPAGVVRRGAGLALLVTRCAPDADAALAAIVTAVERVSLSGSPPGEQLQARTRLAAQLARTIEAPAGMAAWLAEIEAAHAPFTGEDAAEHWHDALLSVDGPAVRAMAQSLPDLQAAVVAIVGPGRPAAAPAPSNLPNSPESQGATP
jgi:predicted Zn-dependent peptidase